MSLISIFKRDYHDCPNSGKAHQLCVAPFLRQDHGLHTSRESKLNTVLFCSDNGGHVTSSISTLPAAVTLPAMMDYHGGHVTSCISTLPAVVMTIT